jgi:hypothetical protein
VVGVEKINLDLYLSVYEKKNKKIKMNIIKNLERVVGDKFIEIEFSKKIKMD